MDSTQAHWMYILDVVNCSRSLVRDVARQMVYVCPDTGGPYTHERAKYFGPYANKKVESIYEIRAVVAIQANFDGGYVKWKNVEAEDGDLVDEASKKFAQRLIDPRKSRVMGCWSFFLIATRGQTSTKRQSLDCAARRRTLEL